ncbi:MULTISPECIES: hypothetical protein [unclassified Aeromicrobium]|uniref:phage tail protein n=1 Tax=unclassified Aeromicrobium TaxID=2633570 RepID=UPI00288C12A6|nr:MULTISPECIES: hypothetical protein [unclassified Aeromicrobium]
MAARQTVAIALLADAAGVRKGTGEAQGAVSRFGSGAMGVLKKVGVAYAAFKGAQLLKDSVVGAIAAVREQDALLGQTKAVLKSTGNAAGVSAGQIVKMSDAMERKSMVDAEQVQNGANVLLTFTKIRNEAGKGNDIFNQGTQAALDMSTALKTDMKSSAILMGKALNDPIKGVTALSKSGVGFTQQQKDLIKSLVESGDTLGAQKIILKEVNTQFAGSAAAAAKADGGVKRLKDMFDGFVESGVRKVLPLFYRVTSYAADTLPGALGKVSAAGAAISPVFDGIGNAIRPVLSFVGNNVEVVGTFVGVIAGVAAVTRTWAIAQGILNAVMAVNPVTLVVLGVAALAAGLVYAYRRSQTFRNVVQGAFSAIQAAAGVLRSVAGGAIRAVGAGFRAVGAIIRGAVSLYTLPFRLVASGARAIWPAVRSALGNVSSAFRGLPGKIRGAVSGAGGWLKSAGGDVVRGFISGIRGMAGSLVRAIKSYVIDKIPGPVKKALGIASPSKVFRAMGGDTVQGFILGLRDRRGALATASGAIAGVVAATPFNLSGAVTLPGKITRAVGQVVNYITLTVHLDTNMTEAQQGAALAKLIRAARSQGLLIGAPL